ncbi:hypothetical protein vseg_019538 [Gypsophila vaccaria]
MERSPNEQNPTTSDETLIQINPTVTTTTSAAANRTTRWLTIDGPLGLSEEDAVTYARRFYKVGFMLLPWFWAVNCIYFWPVLRRPGPTSSPSLHTYVARSAVGFTIFAVVMSAWALTFSIGGERLFGPVWNKLVMYNVADELGLTGWM